MVVLVFVVVLGCGSFDEKQCEWIFQFGECIWVGGQVVVQGMEDVWIDFKVLLIGDVVCLYGLWFVVVQFEGVFVLFYLYGVCFDVCGSVLWICWMQVLGFFVLVVDY